MNILLDTHAFLWSMTSPERLSAAAKDAILSPDNDLHISVVSIWEIVIKNAKGSLQLPGPPGEVIPAELQANGIAPLSVQISHVIRVSDLPLHHRDPFDRLLIAQAQIERIPILTSDAKFAKYDVETIW